MVLFDMVFLPVDVKRPCQPQNNDFPDLFPKRPHRLKFRGRLSRKVRSYWSLN
jgi:hypothetical protein